MAKPTTTVPGGMVKVTAPKLDRLQLRAAFLNADAQCVAAYEAVEKAESDIRSMINQRASGESMREQAKRLATAKQNLATARRSYDQVSRDYDEALRQALAVTK